MNEEVMESYDRYIKEYFRFNQMQDNVRHRKLILESIPGYEDFISCEDVEHSDSQLKAYLYGYMMGRLAEMEMFML